MSLTPGICLVCGRTRGIVPTRWLGDRILGVCRKCRETEDGRRELDRAGES